MAIVRTTITPAAQLFSYSGLNLNQANDYSPRGEVRFNFDGEAIALTGAGDNQQVFVDLRLPFNFAYIMSDGFVALDGPDASVNNFGLVAHASFNNAAGGTITQSIPLQWTSAGDVVITTAAKERKTYVNTLAATGVLVPEPGDQNALFWQITNGTANDAAYAAKGYFRFLQFDISQAYHFRVNSPVPVR